MRNQRTIINQNIWDLKPIMKKLDESKLLELAAYPHKALMVDAVKELNGSSAGHGLRHFEKCVAALSGSDVEKVCDETIATFGEAIRTVRGTARLMVAVRTGAKILTSGRPGEIKAWKKSNLEMKIAIPPELKKRMERMEVEAAAAGIASDASET